MQTIKAQSQIVGAILLILIAISAAAIIGVFATNFVKDQLKETNCFKVAEKLRIENELQYTCYDNTITPKQMRVQVHLLDAEIEGFILEIGGDSTTTYTIKNGPSPYPEIRMYDGSTILDIPGENQQRTYKINITSKPNITAIYPIIEGGKTCDKSDSISNPINCY